MKLTISGTPAASPLGYTSWAGFEWARNPYVILITIYIFAPYFSTTVVGDPHATAEAANEATRLLKASRQPVILAGVEVHRFDLQDQLLALAEASEIPIATTLLGKSVIRETHPLCIGLYEGAMGRDRHARRRPTSGNLPRWNCPTPWIATPPAVTHWCC